MGKGIFSKVSSWFTGKSRAQPDEKADSSMVGVTMDAQGRIYVDGKHQPHLEEKLKAQFQESVEPRAHHFQFAKYWLPHLALGNSVKFYDTFTGDDAQQSLEVLWNGVGTQLKNEEPLSAEGLALTSREAGEWKVILISLPAPLVPNECHFVAAVLKPDQPTELRLFGLEKAAPNTDSDLETVLVEWNTEGRHTYSPAAAAASDAFIKRILQIVDSAEESITFVDLRPMGWFS